MVDGERQKLRIFDEKCSWMIIKLSNCAGKGSRLIFIASFDIFDFTALGVLQELCKAGYENTFTKISTLFEGKLNSNNFYVYGEKEEKN